MTTRNDAPTKRTSWSDCRQISELALLIDATPPAHREEIVRAAVKFEARSELETSYIVGEIRSLVVDGVAQLFGPVVASKFQNLGSASTSITSCQTSHPVEIPPRCSLPFVT